jgi:hypothetical protein
VPVTVGGRDAEAGEEVRAATAVAPPRGEEF